MVVPGRRGWPLWVGRLDAILSLSQSPNERSPRSTPFGAGFRHTLKPTEDNRARNKI
jgi:hypothetical protein